MMEHDAMQDVPIAEARGQLDELVRRATSGKEVLISDPRSGTVRLQPVTQSVPERVPGRWKGRIHIPEDRLLESLSEDELLWVSGEQSS